MTREELIDSIKSNNSFFTGASFSGHTDEDLLAIAAKIEERGQVNEKNIDHPVFPPNAEIFETRIAYLWFGPDRLQRVM